MQNAGLAALGLDWRYLAFEVPPTELSQVIRAAKLMRFIGLNLTVPHKLLALDLVDALDDSAREWGAVNTIRFEARDSSGEWTPLGNIQDEIPSEIRSHGFNTDAEGLAQALREDLGFNFAGTSVLLLGAGGAGRMAALKLASESVSRLYLQNRTSSKAEALAAEIRQRYPVVRVATGYPDEEVDLVINATSAGLKTSDPLPMDESSFALRQARMVYDMIYRPAETPFLKAAKAAGSRVANGIGMLLYQGARALEIWTGQPAPIGVMREALLRNVYGA